MMDISIPYYEDNSRVSNSAIGYFLKSPRYFREKMLGIAPNESTSSLRKGTMIHEYILQPECFNDDYIVCPKSTITPVSANQKKFCEAILNSTEIEPQKAAVAAYKSSYSIVGKSNETIASESLKMAENLKDYIELMKSGKTIISEYDLNKCEALRMNLETHLAASNMLNKKNVEEHHEFHINWEYKDVPCKSLIDCIQFDHKNKVCTIIDLKTTAKIDHFEQSVKNYDYCRQLWFYTLAARWYIENELKDTENHWNFEHYIIALSTDNDNTVRVFQFDQDNFIKPSRIIRDVMDDIHWYIKNSENEDNPKRLLDSMCFDDLWSHTREYWENDGIEHLNLDL